MSCTVLMEFGAVVGVGCQDKNLREDRWELKDRKTGNKEQCFYRSGGHLVFWNNWPAGIWWLDDSLTLVLSRNNLFILAPPEVSLDKLLKITVNGRQVVNYWFLCHWGLISGLHIYFMCCFVVPSSLFCMNCNPSIDHGTASPFY